MTDNDMVLWGTIRGWSRKLGIDQDILRERFKDLPNNPTKDPTVRAYAECDVLEACADLMRPQMVDTGTLEGKEIRKEMATQHEGP